MADGKLEVVHVLRANVAASNRVRAMSPGLRGIWMWTMTMLTSTTPDERRGCLCVGTEAMSFEEWRRNIGLRLTEAWEAWAELLRIGSFEYRTINGDEFVHLYGFETQDLLYKRKGKPVDKSRKTVDNPSKTVDNSDGCSTGLREADNSRLGCSRPIADAVEVTTPESDVSPINNNVPLKILRNVTGRRGGAGPSPPSLPGVGTNGTGKPNNGIPTLRGQPRAPDQAMSVPHETDCPEEPLVDATGPQAPTQRRENGTERSTERAVDDRRRGEGPAPPRRPEEGCRAEAVGCRPEATGGSPVPVPVSAVNALIEELVRGLHDEHSRAFWTRVVREFGRRQDAFVQLVGEWEGMKGRIVEGTGPRNPRSTMNKWALDRLCSLGNVWALGLRVGREGKR